MELDCDRCAIRTREAYALDLKTNPFDHSGILSGFSYHDVTQMELFKI